MRHHAWTRFVLVLGLSAFALGAQCDFTDLIEAICAKNPDDPRCSQEKVVFVTSTAHQGDFGGLAGGDAICNDLADASPQLAGRTFVAWLSTATPVMNAKDRLVEPGGDGFVRVDGAPVAASIADLTDQQLANSVMLDENGNSHRYGVWTGTHPGGAATAYTCQDWTSSSPADRGAFGLTYYSNYFWSWYSQDLCSRNLRLYCFEVDAGMIMR